MRKAAAAADSRITVCGRPPLSRATAASIRAALRLGALLSSYGLAAELVAGEQWHPQQDHAVGQGRPVRGPVRTPGPGGRGAVGRPVLRRGRRLLGRQAAVQEGAAVRTACRAHDHHAVALPGPAVGEDGAQQALAQGRLGVVQQQGRAADPAQPAGGRGVGGLEVLAQGPEEEAFCHFACLTAGPEVGGEDTQPDPGLAGRAGIRAVEPLQFRPAPGGQSLEEGVQQGVAHGRRVRVERLPGQGRQQVPDGTAQHATPEVAGTQAAQALLLGQTLVAFGLRRDRLGRALRDAGRDHGQSREEPGEGERAARALPGAQPAGDLDQGLGRGRAGAGLRVRAVRVHR
ncbi:MULTISPECIES: hypothetical protein [Streptomyces]|uniref:hypothetical protein n=1 Tax=Streptomyces TaxID=1883 RepID=UPI00287F7059|nr:hypothetical protein [Streptomyces sp. CGMCC 4.1456]WNF63459.1 hypothetical protein RJD14_13105 [Streptomyces sp. CGMCC 4.1456]